MAALRRHCNGNRHTVQNQADHIVERDHLQKRIHKIAVRARLANGHHRRGGGSCRGQRRQHDGKAQFQMEHPIDESENRDRGQTRLQHRDDDDLRAVAFEDIDFKKLARAERDKRQSHIRKKIRSVDDTLRNHIQTARSTLGRRSRLVMRVIANPAKSIAEIEIMTRATGEACIDSINFSLSPLPFCFT